MKLYEWKKIPSVSTGGKDYFWLYYEIKGKKYEDYKKIASVVWNRKVMAYALEINGKDDGIADTLPIAKKRVEFVIKTGGFKKWLII